VKQRTSTHTTSKHGTRSRYTKGCRCQSCRDANADYERSRKGGALLDARVRQVVESAGRLTDEQLSQLRALLPAPADVGESEAAS